MKRLFRSIDTMISNNTHIPYHGQGQKQFKFDTWTSKHNERQTRHVDTITIQTRTPWRGGRQRSVN